MNQLCNNFRYLPILIRWVCRQSNLGPWLKIIQYILRSNSVPLNMIIGTRTCWCSLVQISGVHVVPAIVARDPMAQFKGSYYEELKLASLSSQKLEVFPFDDTLWGLLLWRCALQLLKYPVMSRGYYISIPFSPNEEVFQEILQAHLESSLIGSRHHIVVVPWRWYLIILGLGLTLIIEQLQDIWYSTTFYDYIVW